MTAMREIGKIYDGRLDQEYGAALYLLTSSAGLWQKAQGYVSHEVNRRTYVYRAVETPRNVAAKSKACSRATHAPRAVALTLH